MQKSLQNIQDASDDLMMLEEDAMLIPYQIGDVFVSHTQDETQEMLEAAKVNFHSHVKILKKKTWVDLTVLCVEES